MDAPSEGSGYLKIRRVPDPDLICDMDEIKSISFYHSCIDLVNKNKFLCDIFFIFLVTVSDKINDQLQLKNCMFVTHPLFNTVNDDYLRPTSINGGFCVVRFVSLFGRSYSHHQISKI